jgi:hypothetical protein
MHRETVKRCIWIVSWTSWGLDTSAFEEQWNDEQQ